MSNAVPISLWCRCRYYPIGGGHQHAAREAICEELFQGDWDKLFHASRTDESGHKVYMYRPLYYTTSQICVGLTPPQAIMVSRALVAGFVCHRFVILKEAVSLSDRKLAATIDWSSRCFQNPQIGNEDNKQVIKETSFMDIMVTLNRQYKDMCKIPGLSKETINERMSDSVIRMHYKGEGPVPTDKAERRALVNPHRSKLVAIKLPDPVFQCIPRIWKKFE